MKKLLMFLSMAVMAFAMVFAFVACGDDDKDVVDSGGGRVSSGLDGWYVNCLPSEYYSEKLDYYYSLLTDSKQFGERIIWYNKSECFEADGSFLPSLGEVLIKNIHLVEIIDYYIDISHLLPSFIHISGNTLEYYGECRMYANNSSGAKSRKKMYTFDLGSVGPIDIGEISYYSDNSVSIFINREGDGFSYTNGYNKTVRFFLSNGVLRQDGESEEWVKFNPDNIYKVNPSKTFNWEDGGDNNNGGNTEKQSYSSCPDNKHPHLIDLGLPSGTKWACCNVEANSPEQYGGVYSWGEVKTKNDYSWSNYLYGTDYIGDDIGATKYDVAFNKWGSSWRMPTIDQLKELYSKTTCSWISSYNGVGVSGMSFTGSNGKIIFLPVLNDEAINGYYWSSTYSKEQKSEAQYLWFGTKEVKTTTSNRKDGMNVRAVQNKSGGSDSGGGDDSGGGSVESGIILNPTTLEFTNYGGTKDVSITIDGKWTATCKESWIKLSNAEGDGSGKFTVEAEIYPSEPSRTAVITISYGIGKTATYYVKQNGTTFNASIKSNKFTYEGGSTTLSVKATETISWILSRSDNWVYLGKNANYQNDYKGKGNSDVEIFVGMNTNTESRSTVIALKSDFGTKEITISQSGMEDKVEAKLSSSTIKADGGSELLSITAPSSREWKIASKDSWVHFDVENGSGIKSVKVTVDKNEGYYQRSTDITVTSAGVPSKTITITQEPQKMYMTLKTSVQAFTCDENKFTISVTTIPSYLKWTAKKTETWIHFDSKWNNSSQFSYDGTYTLNVYVDENTTFSGRQASITFTSEAGTETVNITQGGRSKPNTNTTLGKMLIYPFGTVNLDMSDATYSQIKSTLGNLYKLESNSGYFFLSQDKNQSLSSYSYRGIPFYRMYVSDNKNDVQICYTFKTGSISDPGAMYDLIVEDFKDIGIPLEVYQMSNSWVKGTYETAFAKFVAEIKYSSYPAGWDYTIEVDYKK